MPKIDPGSVLTLQVTVENVWPDGRVTFRIGDYRAPVTVSPEYLDVLRVTKPREAVRRKPLRDVPD